MFRTAEMVNVAVRRAGSMSYAGACRMSYESWREYNAGDSPDVRADSILFGSALDLLRLAGDDMVYLTLN